jgi:ABC-type lipoprotein release transport system permease subunit
MVAVLGTEIIAILAVTYQSIRASRMKPVDSLRYD